MNDGDERSQRGLPGFSIPCRPQNQFAFGGRQTKGQILVLLVRNLIGIGDYCVSSHDVIRILLWVSAGASPPFKIRIN